MTIKITTFLLLLIFLNYAAKAQKTVTNQSLYWVRYNNQLTINEKWTWSNEIDERRFFENSRQHHLIMHSLLHYEFFQNINAGCGLTYSLQSPQDPNSINTLVVPELRPFQEISFSNVFSKKFTVQQRFRIDERFIHKNNGKDLLDGYDFNFRLRYRLQANFKISKDKAKDTTVLKVADELMLNAGSNIIYNAFDQNRFYIGVEQGINKNISFELGYLYWFQQRATGNQFFSRNIIRLTLYHKIKL